MKIVQCEQGSVEWLEKRAGIVTASEADELVTPCGKIRTGKEVAAYTAKKLAEKWQGPLPSNNFYNSDQGHFGETDTIGWYEFKYRADVTRVGLITTDDGLFGCSPDGLVGEDYGIEIKSVGPVNQVKFLLNGKIPPDYIAQVQMALWVTKYPKWRFISKRNPYPVLMLDVEPDEEYQDALTDALTEFQARFEIGWKRLLELNGGPPPKRIPMVFSNSSPRNTESNGTEFDLMP